MDHTSIGNYMAHGFCFLWDPGLVRLHVISDLITGITYYAVAITLYYFIYKRRDIPFPRIFLLFGLFFLFCGTTHLFAAYTVYVPIYWIEGGIKAMTAFVSVGAMLLYVPLIPKVIALPSLTKALDENKLLSSVLENKVQDLLCSNQRLQDEIAERKQTEDALFSAEKKFGNLLESIQLAAIMLDVEGTLTFCNDYLLSQTGWSRDEVIGKNWFDLFVLAEARSATKVNFNSAIAEGTLPLHYENLIVTHDNAQRLMVWDNSILRNSEGAIIGVASIGTDITEHRKLEDQFRQAQKMDAIGQLAGGVAHDFNNILSAIVGYSHLTLMKMREDDPNRHNIQQILESSNRATVLTQSLLAFSRKQVVNLARVDMNDVVERFNKFLLRLLREDIELKTKYADKELPVLADRGQLEQVLMNLVTNARDAMPNGGRIIIETGQVAMDDVFVATHGFGRAGDYVLLSVTDTGTGIPENAKDKIYDPFFTTKEEGKGTGLGLSMVYGIVKKHQGFITMYSQPDMGTTFKIYLPLVHAVVPTEDENAEEQVPLRGGTETVLLVEDDASLRALSANVLRNYGYTVIEAVDGLDAVVKFMKNQKSIRLTVLDGIMPRMNGK